MRKRQQPIGLEEALRHPDHRRPMTRRQLIAQGFQAGIGTVIGSSIFSLLGSPNNAYASLSSDLTALSNNCGLLPSGAGKIPFICIDLAGGANISGSNVLVGGAGGQLDVLSSAGYSKLGLPGDMIPGVNEATATLTSNGDHTDTTLGLAFHSDSAFLRGILERAPTVAAGIAGTINGAVIPARSDNDTGNNPHNPMYGIARAGANGSLLDIIGSRNSVSGGNSVSPAMMIDPSTPPTKIDRPSDTTGLVDTGDLASVLSDPNDVVAVMESMQRISDHKLQNVSTGLANDAELKTNVNCQYVKTADLADRFSDNSALDPAADPDIVDDTSGIFTQAEFSGNDTDGREFRKTASVMKMVIDRGLSDAVGYAGAGTITMGGYDYHTGDRSTGELRDLRAGRCMGACLEYAARKGQPLMLYVFSDGSVASNGATDNSTNGRGKGVWTGDNSSTAASFFLVYNPASSALPLVLRGADADQQARHQQLGWMRPDASVETSAIPAANNVNLLVETVILNYMALHGQQGQFGDANYFPSNGLGSSSNWDNYIAFNPIQ